MIVLLCFCFIAVYAQTDDQNKQLAKRTVQSAGVKKGEVVIIEGGKHMIPIMESMAIEVAMTGGFPVTLIGSDRVQRAILKDAPDSYLEQVPSFWGEWYKHANVYIGLPYYEDPKALIQDIPANRFEKFSKTYEYFTGILNSLPVREVGITFPTKSEAELNGMDFEAYSKIIYDGINADYASISQNGASLQKALQSGKSLRITTPSGTDITFSMAPNRTVFLDDGIITEEEGKSKIYTARYVALPGGSVYFAPMETSANGKVVVPRARCRLRQYKDVTFELKDGKLVNLNKSPFADCFDEELRPFSGPKDVFGRVWIGLNPSLRNVEDDKADFRHFNTAGMVHIGLGDNRLYGGVNNTSTGMTFPISNATVTVDGKIVVKDGKLVM
jgi:leucyl aminopeptidase (aminopeptidase T)